MKLCLKAYSLRASDVHNLSITSHLSALFFFNFRMWKNGAVENRYFSARVSSQVEVCKKFKH